MASSVAFRGGDDLSLVGLSIFVAVTSLLYIRTFMVPMAFQMLNTRAVAAWVLLGKGVQRNPGGACASAHHRTGTGRAGIRHHPCNHTLGGACLLHLEELAPVRLFSPVFRFGPAWPDGVMNRPFRILRPCVSWVRPSPPSAWWPPPRSPLRVFKPTIEAGVEATVEPMPLRGSDTEGILP